MNKKFINVTVIVLSVVLAFSFFGCKSPESKTLSGIEMTAAPGKTEYVKGEELDLTGLEVTATYSDGSAEPIAADKLSVSGYDKNRPGDQTVTFTYGNQTCTFKVSVSLPKLTALDFTGVPSEVVLGNSVRLSVAATPADAVTDGLVYRITDSGTTSARLVGDTLYFASAGVCLVNAVVGDFESESYAIEVLFEDVSGIEVKVDGQTGQTLGQFSPVTYTASVGKYCDPDTVFEWSVDGVERQGESSAVFVCDVSGFTVGSHKITVKAGGFSEDRFVNIIYMPPAGFTTTYSGSLMQTVDAAEAVTIAVDAYAAKEEDWANYDPNFKLEWYINDVLDKTVAGVKNNTFTFTPSAEGLYEIYAQYTGIKTYSYFVSVREAGYVSKTFTFKLKDDDTYEIGDYSADDSYVYVPAKYNGKAVTSTAANTFVNVGEKEKIKAVKFPEGFVSLKKDTFGEFNNKLHTLELPSTLKEFSSQAFYYTSTYSNSIANSLRNITVADGGDYKAVDGVLLKDGGAMLVYCAPAASTRILDNKSIKDLPAGINKISDYAFAASQFSRVNIGVGMREIGNDVFFNAAIETADIPEGVLKLGKDAFYNCWALKTINLPKTLTQADKFQSECSRVEAINVAEGNAVYSSLDGVLFDADKTTLKTYPINKASGNYVVPDSVKAISARAFQNSALCGVITLNDGLIEIGDGAFSWASIKELKIPDSVTKVGDDIVGMTAIYRQAEDNAILYIDNWAIIQKGDVQNVVIKDGTVGIADNCIYNSIFTKDSIGSLTFPRSMKYVCDGMANNCVDSITFLSEFPPDLEDHKDLSGSPFEDSSKVLFYVPAANKDNYTSPATAKNWTASILARIVALS